MLMKKGLLGILAMLLISFTLNSCKKDVLNPTGIGTNCANAADDISAVVNAFISNPSASTCEAYKSALLDYVNSCAAYAYYDASYEDAIEGMDCSQYDE